MEIFLSYRRDDAGGYTGRIFDHLSERYGLGHVFMDTEAIAPGDDFREHIDRRIKECDAVLVVIGPAWTGTGPVGERRIDSAGDYVRHEIEIAMQAGVTIVPVVENVAFKAVTSVPNGTTTSIELPRI